jgi:chemotaxis protein histidine kinase CheA
MDRMKRTAATEMEMFYRVLHMNPQIFGEFLTGADLELRRINAALESAEGGYGDKLDSMFRAAHTLKGDARLLEMDFFAAKAHEFEDEIVAVRKKTTIESGDFIPLAVRLSELMGMHTQLRSLASRINAFQCAFVEDNVGSDLITWSLKSLIDKAAADQGRAIRFSFASFKPDHIPLEMRKNIKDALVQLTRNAIAHGLETAEERTAAGKSTDAVIEIGSTIENGELRVFLRDDGRGLDYETIRARAVAEGLMSESDAARAGRKELAALIFESHFSTAASVSQDSGRGAGMSVVRKAVERLNGRMVIRNTPGRSCEFELLIPVAAC